MIYRCLKCGHRFTEDEIRIVSEDRGEYHGMPCYENMEYSPCCLEDFVPDTDNDIDEDEDSEDKENTEKEDE